MIFFFVLLLFKINRFHKAIETFKINKKERKEKSTKKKERKKEEIINF